jgi:hypothetical protein
MERRAPSRPERVIRNGPSRSSAFQGGDGASAPSLLLKAQSLKFVLRVAPGKATFLAACPMV